jgi:hypothetical protein
VKPDLKLNLLYIFFLLFLLGCTQPVANSGATLLSSGGTQTSDGSEDEPVEETGTLSITADNPEMSVNIEDNDRVEISGRCSDLNRKSSRILVEAFSGENETLNPYLSNAISDKCIAAEGLYTGNGIPVGSNCFWVSRGVGVVEDYGLPVQKSFPQCVNGRFGFSVRLGAVLQDPPPTGSRYTIRFKLRTTEGGPSSTSWSRVYVSRKLSKPVIEKIIPDQNAYSCTLQMSPARFNQNIVYMISRSTKGGFNSTLPAFNLFVNPTNSLSITPGSSMYNWVSDYTKPIENVIAGVTYTFTLQSMDFTDYSTSGGFSYSPSPIFENSEPVTCSIESLKIKSTGTTNAPINVGGTGPTCYFEYADNRLINPGVNSGVNIEWAFSTNAGWTGPNKDTDIGNGFSVRAVNCNNQSQCSISQEENGVGAGQTIYVAVREKTTEGPIGRTVHGKWSEISVCNLPQP